MRHAQLIHCLLLFSWVFCSQAPWGTADEPEIDQRFRHLIPAATAIDRADFEKIARSPSTPTADSFQQQSLSAVLMILPIMPVGEDETEKRQFRMLQPTKPAELAREMYRSIGAPRLGVVYRPITMIHSERITRCQAKITNDKATGSFDYRVPDLYEGSADFVAKKQGDGWKMVEFQMKTMGVHVVRDKQGKWRRVKEDADKE